MKTYTKIVAWMVLLSLSLAGCDLLGEKPTATPDPIPTGEFSSVINATGAVVPEQWATLSMQGAGIVAEVLVVEGDRVSAGQPLVRLEGQKTAEAAVSAAQFELVSAQQALDALRDNAAMAASQARQALLGAEQALIATQRGMVPFELQRYENDLDRAREDVAEAKDKLTDALEDLEPYKDWDVSNATRKNYQNRLDEAQRTYDEALRVQQELELAKEQAAAALELAQANLAMAQKEYDQRKDGPDADDLNLAQARLDHANAQLLAAQEAVENLELRAPFDGVVCNLKARPGEWFSPGMPVLQVGNLDSLRVETTDLNEIDAARLQPGYAVIVTFDALPGVSVSGAVQSVAQKSAEGSGLNYTVVIQLDEIPAGLRWGMTAFVDIEVQE